MPPFVLLELFSGTGSVGRAFSERGWQVISVDIDPKFDPVIQEDIATFSPRDHNIEHVDCIWASPPCTMYSTARTCAGPNRGQMMEHSDALVQKTLEIAAELGNPALFIENPWSGHLKRRGLLDHLSMRVLDYCKYGMPYRKRTAVWTNTSWAPARPLCCYDCPATSASGKSHTARAQRGPPGPRFTQQQLYRIPAELCDEIADYCSVDRGVMDL